MITDDEVMRLFERADPARIDDDASVIDAAGYFDAVRTRSTNVPIIETTPTPIQPSSRHRRPIIIAAAAAVVLIVIGAVALATRDDDTTQPATDQTTPVATEPAPNPETASPDEVAQAFVEAYGNLDVDRALTYLADDADITGLIDGFTTEEVRGTRDELRLVISLLEAQHYQQTRDSCQAPSVASDEISFRCTFDFQSLGSDQLGLGPFSGNSIEVTTRPLYRDGVGNRWGAQIVRAAYHFDDQRFSDQVWVPFEDWVLANHPQVAVTMYSTALPDGGEGVRLTEEAIPLWEQLIREYVTDKTTQG